MLWLKEELNGETQDLLSPETTTGICNVLGKILQKAMLEKVRLGKETNFRDHVITIVQNVDGGRLEIRGRLGGDTVDALIEELTQQGAIKRDGDRIEGIGKYAAIPLADIEERVYGALRRAAGRKLTDVDLKRTMTGVFMSPEQTHVVVGSLVKKGYVKVVEDKKTQAVYYKLT